MYLTVNGELFSGVVTKEHITASLSALDGVWDSFLILSRDEMHYVQTCGDKSSGFQVEYQEGTLDEHYECCLLLSFKETVDIFHSYFDGTDDWKQNHSWKKMQLNYSSSGSGSSVSEIELEEQSNSMVLCMALIIGVVALWYFLK